MAELTTYADLADILTRLPALLRDERRRRNLSQRAAAREIGVAFATLHRIEDGHHGCVLSNAVAILRWLATSAQPPTDCPRCGAWPVHDPAAAAARCIRLGRTDGGCPDCGACPGCIQAAAAGRSYQAELAAQIAEGRHDDQCTPPNCAACGCWCHDAETAVTDG